MATAFICKDGQQDDAVRALRPAVIRKLKPGGHEMGLSVKITTLATVLSFGFLAAMILGML